LGPHAGPRPRRALTFVQPCPMGATPLFVRRRNMALVTTRAPNNVIADIPINLALQLHFCALQHKLKQKSKLNIVQLLKITLKHTLKQNVIHIFDIF